VFRIDLRSKETEGAKHIAKYLEEHHIQNNPEILEGSYSAGLDTSRRMLTIQLYNLDGQLLFSKDSIIFLPGRSGLPLKIDSCIDHYSRGSHVCWYLPSMEAFGANSPAGAPSYSDMIFDVRIKK